VRGTTAKSGELRAKKPVRREIKTKPDTGCWFKQASRIEDPASRNEERVAEGEARRYRTIDI